MINDYALVDILRDIILGGGQTLLSPERRLYVVMKTVDLFCGCGGLSLGFQNAGFNLIAAFDAWTPAVQVYQANFSHSIFNRDLSDPDIYLEIAGLKPEIIIGGPPCQDFSSAGKRDERLGRADLTIGFANIVSQVKPNWFLMENVERISKSSILKSVLDTFKKEGYGLTSSVLNASYYGVPQNRKRYFLIGQLGGRDHALDSYLSARQSKQPMTVFDYLGDRLGIEYFYRHPRSYQRRAIFSIHEPSPTIRGVNRPIPKTYQQHPGDACEVNEYLRPLTTIERSYLQTFPETFKFQGSKSDLEQMIGNAVPVKLGEYVGRSILQYIQDTAQGVPSWSNTQLKLFDESLIARSSLMRA